MSQTIASTPIIFGSAKKKWKIKNKKKEKKNTFLPKPTKYSNWQNNYAKLTNVIIIIYIYIRSLYQKKKSLPEGLEPTKYSTIGKITIQNSQT